MKNINCLDRHKYTPLCKAAEYGHTEIAELLIEQGADQNIGNSSGELPLHKAVDEGTYRNS